MSSSSAPARRIRSVPGLMRVRSGMCSGRMPSSPASPGAMTMSASPEKIDCSALTMSTWMVFAMCCLSKGAPAILLKRLRLLEGFLDRADHVEGLLRQRVALAVHDHLEALDRLLERDVLARRSGENLGHVEGLRQEALDLARTPDRELVLGRKLVHAEDRDDVAQLLIALQHRLHRARRGVVVLADDIRIDLARGRIERIDRGIDPQRRDVAREHDGRVEVAESG